jgi:hypothetical protein
MIYDLVGALEYYGKSPFLMGKLTFLTTFFNHWLVVWNHGFL